MIIHIVIFQLIRKDSSSLEAIRKELLKLKDLPSILELNIIEKSSILKSFIDGDLILFSKFENKKKLESYMLDQKHLKVIKNTTNNIQEKYILDFTY